MSDVVPSEVVAAANYYHDVNGQIYKADAPANAGDTIIPFPSETIDAHLATFGPTKQPYGPAADVIEDRSEATATAENVKYHPFLTDMKLAEMTHVLNTQLQEAQDENAVLETDLEAANSKISELEAEIVDLQQQLADATKPPLSGKSS